MNPARRELKDRASRYHDAIRRILREWDPIGVADVAPQSEYDCYVGEIHGMLDRHESKDKLVDHLLLIETDNMGLPGNRQRAEVIADRLLELRHKLEGSG